MIQIDMKMPTNCLDCPACNEYLMCVIPVNGRKWGENDVREFGQGRPEWCPLKEQEAVVRCKDCKHGEECVKPYKDYWCNLHDFYQYGNWFCADGERKEGR